MSFKENLKDELNYQGVLVKELSSKSGVGKRTIDNYLRSNESQPTAENAVKIAQALNVTVEYLVTGKNSLPQTSTSQFTDEEIHLYKKFRSLIESCKDLSPKNIQLLKQVAESFEKE